VKENEEAGTRNDEYGATSDRISFVVRRSSFIVDFLMEIKKGIGVSPGVVISTAHRA